MPGNPMNDRELRPRIVVSRCLGFARCRYDGVQCDDAFVAALRPHAQWITVCPEMALGLGCPRPRIRVVVERDRRILFQPDTSRDLTQAMLSCCASLCAGFRGVDGFILKSKSPSCGLRGTKTYADRYAERHVRRGTGYFADAVRERFGHLPMEDERRLAGSAVRRAFLTRVFAGAALRRAARARSLKALSAFHEEHRDALNAVDVGACRKLDALLNGGERLRALDARTGYERQFLGLVARNAGRIVWPLPEPAAALIRESRE